MTVVSITGFSQAKKGDYYFKRLEYIHAIPYYIKALKHEKDSSVLINLARSYYALKSYTKARQFYELAIQKFPENKELLDEYTAVLKANNELSRAKEVVLVYANRLDSAELEEKLISIEKVLSWKYKQPRFVIKNLEALNTPYTEFSLVPYGKSLAFVTNRFKDITDENMAGVTEEPYFKVSIVEVNPDDSSFSKPKPLKNVNGPYHTGPIFFSQDGKTAYFSRVDFIPGKGKDFVFKPQLYYVTINEKGKWSKPIPFEHNNPKYSFLHPTLSPDGTLLAFASDMKEGHKFDIYISQKQSDGKWSKPQNIGNEVNTAENELFPYLYSKDTLYFSSDGHLGFGGLDIFRAVNKDGKWGNVENLQEPINSAHDDFGIVFTDKNHGYFSSNREGGKGEDDIYSFTKVEPPKNITEIRGVFMYSELAPAKNKKLELVDEEGNVVQFTFTDNEGNFVFEGLPIHKDYGIRIDEEDPQLTVASVIYVKDKNDRIVDEIHPISRGYFAYTTLSPEEVEQLSLLAEENPEMFPINLIGQVYQKLPGDYSDSIEVMVINEDGEVVLKAFLDSSGVFNFKNLPYGSYTLHFSEDVSDKNLILLDEEGKFKNVPIKIDGKNYYIIPEKSEKEKPYAFNGKIFKKLPGDYHQRMKINVVDEDGNIIYTTFTDEYGNFAFEKLPFDANFKIEVQDAPEDLELLVVSDIGEEQLLDKEKRGVYRLSNEEYQSLIGSIYQKLPGDYSGKMEVYLIDDEGNIVMKTLTDEAGNFVFKKLPPDGKYKIKLAKEEDVNLVLIDHLGQEHLVEKNGDTYDLQAQKIKMQDLVGNIYKTLPGDYNQPLEVYLVDEEGNIVLKTITDEKGNFVFENLPMDKNFSIKVQGEEDVSVLLTDEVGEMIAAGKLSGGEFEIQSQESEKEKSGFIAGEIFKKLPGDYSQKMEVYLVDEEGNIIMKTYTDENGKFKFENLPVDKTFRIQLANASEDFNLVFLDENNRLLEKGMQDESGNFVFHTLPSETEYLTIKQEDETTLKIRDDFHFQVHNIFYDFRTYNLNDEAKKELDKVVTLLKNNPHVGVIIKAHTDNVGDEQYNLYLSELRAKSARDYLVSKGIDKSRIRYKGYGETQPIAPNTKADGSDNPEGRAKNRRAEIVIKSLEKLKEEKL
ncbi:MAG: hypothetical protein D6707_09065 [Bacteroidetes bacterium]|nr:MAG: hypothetical protein D6707_09065 [Bacteroidota bacterium]